MNQKIMVIVLLFITGVVVSRFMPQSYAQVSSTTYVWQYLTPQSITGADDLKTKLDTEVNKVIKAGHLLPFRTLMGKTDPEADWYHAYDTVYTLSLAYPYVSTTTQAAIKTYLQSEMATYPLWNAAYLSPTVGTKRQPDIFPDSQYSTDIQFDYTTNYGSRPKLFAMYALWLYAQNTGDWQYIQNNWTSITSFYNSNRSEAANEYTSIAGAIGMARMAKEKTTPDSSMQTTATNDVTTGMTNGQNFAQFGLNAENAYKWSSQSGNWTYTTNNFYIGFQFLDISPEIGRYFFDNTTLKGNVLGTSTTTNYSLNTGEYRYQDWWMAQAPYFGKVYGEDSQSPPTLKAMIFPIHAWVLKDPASTLRKYLDVPDAPIGDYYYMQNLARTIQASGNECWTDLTTNATTCLGPTSAPKKGDVNNDNTVNATDMSLVLNAWFKSNCGTNSCDVNGDGKVNAMDAVVTLVHFGQ